MLSKNVPSSCQLPRSEKSGVPVSTAMKGAAIAAVTLSSPHLTPPPMACTPPTNRLVIAPSVSMQIGEPKGTGI